jgi:hypothetical protein
MAMDRVGEQREAADGRRPFLSGADLALWNPEMKHVVEPGTFTISTGPNSIDLKSAKVTVIAR